MDNSAIRITAKVNTDATASSQFFSVPSVFSVAE